MNCDRIAPHYWWIEKLGMGTTLERRRRWFLPELENARRALVLGDGDGRFLRELLRTNCVVRADYVDLSRRMLELARRRAGSERVDYAQGDARTLELPNGEYDLVATHFFFDCFEADELNVLIGRIAASTSLARGGSSQNFAILRWLRDCSCACCTYSSGSLPGSLLRKLVNHRPILRAHGFRLLGADQGALVVSELWER